MQATPGLISTEQWKYLGDGEKGAFRLEVECGSSSDQVRDVGSNIHISAKRVRRSYPPKVRSLSSSPTVKCKSCEELDLEH